MAKIRLSEIMNGDDMHFEEPKVILLRHTAEPEKIVASAARLCYSSADIIDLQESMTEKKISSLIRRCISMGHMSVLEHASFSFGVEGISRAMTHQLVRHRVASYSQQSQRYVEYDDVGFIAPDSINSNPELQKDFSEMLKNIEKAYRALVDKGIPAEDARYILPNATSTKIVITMNARELRHFFKVRCCNRAQWEIRDVAIKMLGHCRSASPVLFADCGPSCLTGPCPEGKLTCGKIAEVREFFTNLSS